MKEIFNLLFAYYKVASIKYDHKELLGKKIVFNTVRIMSLPLHQELFLAVQLAEMGANVTILLDDGLFKHWDTFQVHDQAPYLNLFHSKGLKRLLVKIKFSIIKKIYYRKNINFVFYREIFNPKQIITLTKEEKNHAISSVRRFFETGSFNINNSEHYAYYQLSIGNCTISKNCASNFFSKEKIDLIITSHGIYSVWGPFFIQAKRKGIPIIVYGAHAYRSQEIIISSVLAQVLSQDPDWFQFQKNHVLASKEKDRVIRYFNSRINHSAFDTSIYYGDIESFKKINIRKKTNHITFGMFPNIIWDGDVSERDTIFNGVVDWVIQTVRFFKHSSNTLVIRFHPAEASLWKDSLSFEKILREMVPDISNFKNIKIISSGDKVDTYDFIKNNIDVGLIYDGVLAMEMTYLKVPVISCAKSRYTGAGFTIEPKTTEDYFSLLDDGSYQIQEFHKNYNIFFDKLLKYSFWYFFVAGYHFPIFDKKIPLKINFLDVSKNNLNMDLNPKFHRTIKKVISYI